LDTIIDETGITWYNMRIYLILSLFFLADGAEMIVLSLLIKKLGEIWELSDSQKGFTGSAVFIGFFIGALIAGKLSDVHGRKPVFVAGALIVSIFSLASAFASDFITFLILRAFNGFGIGISIPSASSLAVEITPSKWRSWVMNLVWIFFPVGEVIVSVIARSLLKKDDGWRYLLGLAAFPSILSAIISFFIYESPRFYFTIRNYDKAFNGLERMIEKRKNSNNSESQNKDKDKNKDIEMKEKNVNISDNINNNNSSINNTYTDYSQPDINPYEGKLDNFFKANNKLNDEGKKIIKRENERVGEEIIKPEFKTLLKKKYFSLTILCCLIFFVCSFVYYGVIYILPQTIMGTKSLEKNLTNFNTTLTNINNLTNKNDTNLLSEEDHDEMYKGIILSAISEVTAIFLTGYIGNIPLLGRKGSLMFGFILAGISSVLCAIFMNNLIIFATALKFSISIPFGVILVYVSEAFPTKIRTISIGVTNSFNRIGGILTPIISQLAFATQPNDPYKIYAIMCFIASFFSYMLPFETLGRLIK